MAAKNIDDTSDIVRMANQIATFFAAYPHDEAVREIAYHLTHFWDPRMREQLRRHIKAGGRDLSPLALEAGGKIDAAGPLAAH